jgi:CubicO group peptidase (beta-lactamase class C family)
VASLLLAAGLPVSVIVNARAGPRLLVVIAVLATVLACVPAAPQPSPTPTKGTIDYAALEAAIEQTITTGPPSLDNVRAVIINVDGETKIAHFRHGYTGEDHLHVWSVTKSIVSTLIGIAIADGLIADLDQPLSALLPKHRKAMSGQTAKVTLRQLMSMTAGFERDPPEWDLFWEEVPTEHGDFIDRLLERRLPREPGRQFLYSDVSAHLVTAVLAAVLQRANTNPRTVLKYARVRLFDPLGITTRPAFSDVLGDPYTGRFDQAEFAWGTDPDGIEIGGFGLRLSPLDMVKIGELYRQAGVWQGKQLVPAKWIREATTASEINPRYGLLWWLSDQPKQPGFGAFGAGGQRIFVLPEAHAVVVIQAATPRGKRIADDEIDLLGGGVILPALQRI